MASAVKPDLHRRPRVLILIKNSSSPRDRRVVPEVSSLVADGYVTSVICPADVEEPPRESLRGVQVRRYRPRTARDGALSQGLEYLSALAKTLWLMIRLSRTSGCGVIQACNPPDIFFLIMRSFKLAGKRFIFDQHDLTPEICSSLCERDRGLIMRVLRRCERFTYALCDAVTVCNESYRHLFEREPETAHDRSSRRADSFVALVAAYDRALSWRSGRASAAGSPCPRAAL
jgi:hypothetical protein